MKRIMVYTCLVICLVACSGSKNIDKEVSKTEKVSHKSYSNDIIRKVNLITEVYSNTRITSIARSKIRNTKKGFQWEFVNVKTGQAYIIDTDYNFGSVTIVKKPKNITYNLKD